MKANIRTLIFVVLCICTSSIIFAQKKELNISAHNRSSAKVIDYTAEIPLNNKLNLPFQDYIATSDNQTVPAEFSEDLKGNASLIFPVSVINGGEKKQISIIQGSASRYPKRTYAELSHKIGGKFEGKEYVGEYAWVKPNYMRVPDNFTDHAYYIRNEGPGWESDKVAFRFYLDWRNAIDVFGKKTPGIVLPGVGIDGYETYHHMGVWGMDNMKVGNSLGIGSIAVWDGEKAIRVDNTDSTICYIKADGKIRSQVMTTYYGWKANGTKTTLKSLISIDAGSRASHMELQTTSALNNIATGIIKNKDTQYFTSADDGSQWAYIATFGKQSLNNDMMGLALFYRKNQLQKITEDKLNHVVVLTPTDGYVEYYFMPTWELDWEPVKTIDDFRRCIDEVMNRLNNRVEINVK